MESRKIREPIREKNRVNFDPNSDSKTSPSSKKKKKSKPQEDVVANRVDEMQTSKTSSGLGKIWLLWVFKVLLVILAVLFVLLIIILAVNFIGADRDDSSNNIVISNESNQSNDDIIHISNDTLEADNNDSNELLLFQPELELFEIIIVENENCEFCQINETKTDLTQLLVSLGVEEDVEFTHISFDSSLANQVLEILRSEGRDFDFTPLFILPNSIENLELFQEPEFRSLFVSISSQDFYVLNPQITTIKYLNSPLILPENTISFGNLEGVPITYVFDYNCVRCQVMSGNEEEVNNFISLNLIEANYTAPIPQLLSALIEVENSNDDLTFNLRVIPAPVSPNSEISHRAIFCATNQDLFIPMHVELVEIHNGSTVLSIQDVVEIAQINIPQLNLEEFESCVSSQDADNYINDTYDFLRNYGVTSLPFTIISNYPIPELIDYETLLAFLESEMLVFN